jgi:serine/threonine protein kinase, bacterial
VDASGIVYVADYSNNKIRKVATDGTVTSLAGSGIGASTDGAGNAASFGLPTGVASDASANLFVTDSATNKLRKVIPTGVVTTLAGSGSVGFADGAGASAEFNSPTGIASDATGLSYVADTYNNAIRKVTPGGVVTTLAGSGSVGSTDGTGSAASFSLPGAVAVDASGNVYVADSGNSKIRRITSSGIVTTLAGSGAFGSSDGVGTTDTAGRKIRKISAQ